MATKRALTFTPPSQRAAKLAAARAKTSPASKPTSPATNVRGIRESVDKALRAPKAPVHPDNVKQPQKAAEGVSVTIQDHEAVVVLGSLLDSRDKALKAAEEASTAGNEALADQLLAKSVLLESLCERVGKSFVERRMGKK